MEFARLPLRLEVIASLQYTNGFSASFGIVDNCLKLIRKGYILNVFLNNSCCRQLMMHCYSVGWLVGWLVTGRAVEFPTIHLSYRDTHCMCVGEINKATEPNINNLCGLFGAFVLFLLSNWRYFHLTEWSAAWRSLICSSFT